MHLKNDCPIWGDGAKGVTFANHVDSESSLINCIIDMNPKKQGKYITGTGHRVFYLIKKLGITKSKILF